MRATYYVVQSAKEWIHRQRVYRQIRLRSLGFQSRVYWDGQFYTVDDISSQFGSVRLGNGAVGQLVPREPDATQPVGGGPR